MSSIQQQPIDKAGNATCVSSVISCWLELFLEALSRVVARFEEREFYLSK